MMNKSVLLLLLTLFASQMTGCSLLAPEEPAPKPVVPKKASKSKPQPNTAQKPKEKAVPGTATYSIDDGKNQFKMESTLPAFQGEVLTQPVTPPAPGLSNVLAAPVITATPVSAPTLQAAQPVPAPVAQNTPVVMAQPATVVPAVVPQMAQPVTQVTVNSALNSQPQMVALAQPAPPVSSVSAAVDLGIQIEEASLKSDASPAIQALIRDADSLRSKGDLDNAVVNLDRALRIDSRNPVITYKLAQIRLKQNKAQMAEELASKAALLAGGNLDLKRKSWMLIADARQSLKNYQGARDAKTKADSFFGH